MKFTDEAFIYIDAGNGGHGCLSFRRERFRPRGGPDGGNGGKGADINIHAENRINTLVDFASRRHFRAQSGDSGSGADRHGRNGKDMLLVVPLGTSIYDEDADMLLGDLNKCDEVLCVARGGKGGFGNAHFKSSTNRAPRHTTNGEDGETRQLRLVLSVLADVGLWGAPNAGKSSLLTAMSAANPKIANYAFTTLWPHLGVISLPAGDRYVLADIPGLLPGAASGVGLGTRFLKHLSRTRLLLHLVDISTDKDWAAEVRSLRKELHAYSVDLGTRESWLVLNKCDLLSASEAHARTTKLRDQLNWSKPIFEISALHRHGLDVLNSAIADWLIHNTPNIAGPKSIYARDDVDEVARPLVQDSEQ